MEEHGDGFPYTADPLPPGRAVDGTRHGCELRGSHLCYQRFPGGAANGFPSMLPTVFGLCCQWVPIYVTNGFRAKLILLIAMSYSLPMIDLIAQWNHRLFSPLQYNPVYYIKLTAAQCIILKSLQYSPLYYIKLTAI